jgi:hypothetical protein
VVAVTFDTVVPDAIPAPVTVAPGVTLAGTEAKVKVVLPFFVWAVVLSGTGTTALESVTVVAVNDTTVVPDGIAEGWVVSVTPMPTFIVAGTDAKYKMLSLDAGAGGVAAFVMSVTVVVPVTAFESVTVVAVSDTTVVQAAIAEELV